MVQVQPIWIDGYPFTAVQVDLPKTTLLAVANSVGYAMCGALDVELLRTKLASRNIVAMRATGVRTLDQLLAAEVESQTQVRKRSAFAPACRFAKRSFGSEKPSRTADPFCARTSPAFDLVLNRTCRHPVLVLRRKPVTMEMGEHALTTQNGG